jgi:uncharacterized protein YbaP (TraB family)
MVRILFLLLTLSSICSNAQIKKQTVKKYPSLLWEITGNGVKKPSYLFGTMHVSSKIAFHLADSFYLGIRKADVVALETNPESWQEDMTKYELEGSPYSPMTGYGGYSDMPNDYLSLYTLKFFKYDGKIERSLFSNPSTINNLLYRTYGNESSDFEEDTFLDMYIYQCGKKWGKKVAGVENYAESMRLMQEAYQDAAKEKKKKERSYDIDDDYSMSKLQEAYRKGNLDQLDSINKLNSFSDAFDEKFMYRRNEIQANSIDSILRSNVSLFVGVGASHLPGSRGVIELLRKMGYRLRPVMMGERDSQHKDQVERLRVPVTFNTETAEDGFYKVDIPGKFFKFGDDFILNQRQYADMANGSYYMVTRISTNAWMWGHNSEEVYKKIDSLLYENIPGKIVSKTRIVRNGYTGFDITNKTRRGDIQRYNIFVTPFEIIFFKMSGNSDYVKNGVEAQRFFGSIQLKEFKPLEPTNWKKYTPPLGGFSVEFPHEPFVDDNWAYDAEDRQGKSNYRVIRLGIHNYNFAEEDTFDLGLMAESFGSSEFIDTLLSRKQGNHKGYPSLDCKFRTKSGEIFLTRFLIQGPHYYTLVASGKEVTPRMQQFLNSFEVVPFIYGEVKPRKDTLLYYTVKSPVFPEQKKERLEIPRFGYYGGDDEDEETEEDALADGAYRSQVIENDTTGEKIYISFSKASGYFFDKDSINTAKRRGRFIFYGDTTWIVRTKKEYKLPDSTRVLETVLSDTGSSRIIISKYFYRNGIAFSLMTQSDTLSKPSSFVSTFFETFKPVDTLKGIDLYTKKSGKFFADFFSSDSVLHKRAVRNIQEIYLDSSDLLQLRKAINWLTWDKKGYLDIKKSLIGKLDAITNRSATDYLKEIYYAAGDTIELQYSALESLLQQKTQYAYNVFRDIITSEPPVIEGKGTNYWDNNADYFSMVRRQYRGYMGSFDNDSFLDELQDSLQLTRTIFAELLPLVNLDDYKTSIMSLLGNMIDSNLVKPKDYDIYFSKFLLEAKQALKKQAIAEKKKSIKEAEEIKEDKKISYPYYAGDDKEDKGNDELGLYATLLMPYWDVNPNVQPVFRQMLASSDKRLKYNTMVLMMRGGKPVNDTLVNYFAGMDEFRYELYSDLRRMKKIEKFPSKYNNHIDLGRSSLLDFSTAYSKPDTIAYVDRLPAEAKGKKGFVYFFKYKSKKEDVNWRLATVGLVPEDPKKFEFENSVEWDAAEFVIPGWHTTFSQYVNGVNLSGFKEAKITGDEPLDKLLKTELRKILYSLRKSAKEFYDGKDPGSYPYAAPRGIEIGD